MKPGYDVLRAARNGCEDKIYLFRIIQEMTELNRAADMNGLLSIDKVLWPGFNADCIVFDSGINIVSSGCDAELVESIMHNFIFTVYESGTGLMKTILIAAGFVSIARGYTSCATSHLLAAYMGDEYIKEYDKYCESDEYKEHLNTIYNLLHDNTVSRFTGL